MTARASSGGGLATRAASALVPVEGHPYGRPTIHERLRRGDASMQLQRVEAYGVECGITLVDGRAITLAELSQELTYEGLLEGHPTTADNDRHIAYFLEAEQRRSGWRPLLIDPPRRARWRDDDVSADDVVERRPPEWLPMVRCVGRFRSFPTGLVQDAHESGLTLVWFQDHYALPIAEEVFLRIRALDWSAHAHDYEI